MIYHLLNRKILAAAAICSLVMLAQWVTRGCDAATAINAGEVSTEIEIVIDETSRITGERILLGEIAGIQAPEMLKEAISKIDLGAAPKPGAIKYLEKRKLLSALRSKRYLPETLRLKVPGRIYIHREGQQISTAGVTAFVKKCLAAQFKNKMVRIDALHIRGQETYPLGELAYKTDDFEFVDRSGRLSKRIEVMVNGRREDVISIGGSVAVFDDVLCVAEAFDKGKILSEADTVFLKKNIFDIPKGYLHSKNQVTDKLLLTSLRKGDPVVMDVLASVPLVHKGDVVQLAVQKESLMIVTSALSREDGCEGAWVRVENLQSGKTVRGIVKGASLVEVIY